MNERKKREEEEKEKRVREIAKKTGIQEKEVVDHIDILVNLIKVRSGLGGNVTEDYVLAYFGEAERDFIRENFENAEYAKNIITRFGEKGYEYKWNEEKKDWEKNEDGSYKKMKLEKTEIDKIKNMGAEMFKFFMIQPHLIAILHRNKEKNFIVKLLGKGEEEKETTIGQMDERSFMERMKDTFKGKKEDYED